jgi:acetyltransferase-like isoleucine patch superfamily enzyme
MAPGYLFFGAGASYIPEGKGFNLYLSPASLKATFVLDQDLANDGAFGVKKAIRDDAGNIITPGENTFIEFGILINNTWKKEIGKNIILDHRLNLYTDYLRSFGNVDIDWELNLNLQVNEFIKANIGTQIIYDDDILFDEVKADDGSIADPGEPRIQFRQLLGIGIAYNF